MKKAILLVMHGSPPKDFPRREFGELMGLHSRLGSAEGKEREASLRRHDVLEARVRSWPRSAENDPYWAGSHELAEGLHRVSGLPVYVGFNEFCAPTIIDAIEEAVADGAEDIVVVTPMMTRGGGHAEQDIPQALETAARRHPEIGLRFAWPFESEQVAGFLWSQIRLIGGV